VTVTPSSASPTSSGGNVGFTLTAIGSGSTTVVVSGGNGQSATINVGVTITTGTIQSHRRK
jgi:hypothetical protein